MIRVSQENARRTLPWKIIHNFFFRYIFCVWEEIFDRRCPKFMSGFWETLHFMETCTLFHRPQKLTTRIPMLSNNPSMAARGSNPQFLWHQKPEPGRIQVRTRSQHSVLRQSAQFPCNVSEDVNRITDNQQQRVGRVLYKFGDDEFENVRVPLDQIKTRFSFSLASSSRNNANSGACGDCVICNYRFLY